LEWLESKQVDLPSRLRRGCRSQRVSRINSGIELNWPRSNRIVSAIR